MDASFEHLLNTARDWAEQAVAAQWLAPSDIRPLVEVDSRSPATLFESATNRPLVVAFFGGTGVGKSSLLNRLARQPVARTGVERPTSREVSMYLHESVHLRSLPRDFPLEQVRTAFHHDDRRRQILWIDMPDIDSVEQANRELVLDWLPHIDVLIYVVSPERYRDDKGWRLLRAHGGEHAWIFVLNQWDRGHPEQYPDFRRLLDKAGFRDPIILRTDCRENTAARKADDFEQLEDILQGMAERHVIHQLEIRAEALRLDHLHSALGTCLEKLGQGDGYAGLAESWNAIWRDTEDELLKGLEWPIQNVARAFVGHDANPLRRSIDMTRPAVPESHPDPAAPRSLLWDEWAEHRLRDALDRLVVEAGDRDLPALPAKARLDRVFGETGRLVLEEGQRSLRHALANPGNAFQRVLLKISGTLAVLLPAAAIGWASYEVATRYYRSAVEEIAYLGTDFAVHSGLLILLAWLLPYFLYRKLRPSAERTAIRGLRAGIMLALDLTGQRVDEALRRLEQERQEVLEEGHRIATLATSSAPETAAGGLLERMLPAARRRGGQHAATTG